MIKSLKNITLKQASLNIKYIKTVGKEHDKIISFWMKMFKKFLKKYLQSTLTFFKSIKLAQVLQLL